MNAWSWEGVYATDWQALWALWIVPIAFLLFRVKHGPLRRGAIPPAARFLDLYCVVFAVETMIDPFCTTLLVRWWGGADGPNATALGLFFVLLGDFRVFLLAFACSGGSMAPSLRTVRTVRPTRPWRMVIFRSLLLTALVPVAAYVVFLAGQALVAGELHGRWLWLAHESLFVALALGLRRFWSSDRLAEEQQGNDFTRGVLAFSALYYALWAIADGLILAGFDAGFALRIVPNQLYYAFWVPFVWWRFARVN